MIQKQLDMSEKPKTSPYYRITASLLNSWQRIWDAKDFVREAEGDTVSLETKIDDAMEKAYKEFLDVLNRVPTPDNEYMKRGREYEASVYAGKDEIFSPICSNGVEQATYYKKLVIDGENICLYGVLDYLKAGKIYDIKRVSYYSNQKYKTSHQHPMYFELVPEASEFTYLIMDDKGNRHTETYIPENCEDIKNVVSTFISWIKSRGLWETFAQNWNNDQLLIKRKLKNI